MRLGGVRLEFAISTVAAFIGLYWKVIGWIILTSFVLVPWFALVRG